MCQSHGVMGRRAWKEEDDDLQNPGAGVFGAGGTSRGSWALLRRNDLFCCLECRSTVLRQPRGRRMGNEFMMGRGVGYDGGEGGGCHM